MKVNRIHIVAAIFNRVNRVKSIGTNKDNITCFTIKVIIINVKLRSSLMNINQFNIRMPMKENVRLTVFCNGSCERIRSALIFVNDIFV